MAATREFSDIQIGLALGVSTVAHVSVAVPYIPMISTYRATISPSLTLPFLPSFPFSFFPSFRFPFPFLPMHHTPYPCKSSYEKWEAVRGSRTVASLSPSDRVFRFWGKKTELFCRNRWRTVDSFCMDKS